MEELEAFALSLAIPCLHFQQNLQLFTNESKHVLIDDEKGNQTDGWTNRRKDAYLLVQSLMHSMKPETEIEDCI